MPRCSAHEQHSATVIHNIQDEEQRKGKSRVACGGITLPPGRRRRPPPRAAAAWWRRRGRATSRLSPRWLPAAPGCGPSPLPARCAARPYPQSAWPAGNGAQRVRAFGRRAAAQVRVRVTCGTVRHTAWARAAASATPSSIHTNTRTQPHLKVSQVCPEAFHPLVHAAAPVAQLLRMDGQGSGTHGRHGSGGGSAQQQQPGCRAQHGVDGLAGRPWRRT